MARDEEKVIKESLDSICWLTKQRILADTGSVDSTKQILSQYVNTITEFAWPDSFSAARNILQASASSDYICMWDADFILEESSQQKLKDKLQNAKQIPDLISFTLATEYEVSNQGVKVLKSQSYPFIYRKQKFTWKYPIHNELTPLDQYAKSMTTEFWPEIVVLHKRDFSDKPWRYKQTKDLLLAELAKYQDSPIEHARILYYLAKVEMQTENIPATLSHLLQILEVELPGSLQTQLHELKAFALEKYCLLSWKIGNFVKTEEYSSPSIKNHPRITLLRAEEAIINKQIDRAKKLLSQYLSDPYRFNEQSIEYDIQRFEHHPQRMLQKLNSL